MPNSLQEFGDAFGLMNAAVSACAFAVLIITMFLQREELDLTRKSIAEELNNLHTSLTANIHSQLFTSGFTVLNMLLDRPELRQFIYERRELSASDDEELRQRVKVLCEVFSDFFELVCVVMGKVADEPTWKGWIEYISDVISQSPQLRQHFRDTKHWVSALVFRDVVIKGFQKAGEQDPFARNVQEAVRMDGSA